MKTEECNTKRICPECGQVYRSVPAVSRKDNKTLICTDCGTLQALESTGISREERLKILEIIHNSTYPKANNT